MMLQMLQLRAEKVRNCDRTREVIGCWHSGKAHAGKAHARKAHVKTPEHFVGSA